MSTMYPLARPLIALIALLAVAAAGCGGDKDGGASTRVDDPAARSTGVLRQAVLAQEAVETLRAEFEMVFDFGEDLGFGATGFGFSGEMQMRGTDAHMVIEMFGEEMEMLLLLPDLYMNIPGAGWVYVDIEDFGFDADTLRDLIENQGFTSIEDLAELEEKFEHVGDEVINGEEHRHLRAVLSFADLMGLADSMGLFGPDADLELDPDELAGGFGDVVVEVWVNKATDVATRTVMDMSFDLFGETMNMTMRFDIIEINGDVTIPGPPADARPASELDFDFGEL